MFSQVDMKEIVLHRRYFVKYSKNYMYFGTATSHTPTGIQLFSAAVNVFNSKFYTARFSDTVFTSMYSFYVYLPYKMEEIMVNKILKRLLGDDFFYPLSQGLENCIVWS
jgi:hypothetical protein